MVPAPLQKASNGVPESQVGKSHPKARECHSWENCQESSLTTGFYVEGTEVQRREVRTVTGLTRFLSEEEAWGVLAAWSSLQTQAVKPRTCLP